MRRHKRRKLNADINVVPYIDVMMVLLVIFMITAPMLTQGVKVELPQAAAKPVNTKDKEPLIISVNAKRQYFIELGTRSKQPLEAAQVASKVKKVLAKNPGKALLVRGDKNVKYDAVVQLMVLLQRAGASSVGLVTE